jgi:hypothetical protein
MINNREQEGTRMAIRKSIMMLSNTGTNWNVVGEPIRGNAYYGYDNGICTIQVIYQNLVGGFGMQGTLAIDPQPEDWFWIRLNPNGDVNTPFIPYPIDPYAPTGNNGGDTGSMAVTFIGNFVFLRAVLTRDYLQPVNISPVWSTWQYGQIDRVLLSL